MIDPIAELRAELDAARDDIARLRAQLAAGMGVPDPAGNAGKALTVVGTVPAWTTLPVPVTSVGAAAPITTTGGATPTIGHANSGVSAGTYTLATITVDARGHITSASSGSASVTWGSIGGFITLQSDLQAALNAKGNLSGGNAWSGGAQTFATAVGGLRVADYYSPGSITPAANTWYRIATLPASNAGQEAVIYVRVNRGGGGGEGAYRFRLFKTTADGVRGTGIEYDRIGIYNTGYGISNARVVDGGSNQPSYLDVQFATAEAYTPYIMSESRGIATTQYATLGFVSQGTAAAGVAFAVNTNMRVLADSTQGVYWTIADGGAQTMRQPLAVASGGTGASTAAGARTALGLSGAITVSSAAPSGGADGDIWLQW